jgi:hypothetical protein
VETFKLWLVLAVQDHQIVRLAVLMAVLVHLEPHQQAAAVVVGEVRASHKVLMRQLV